jgi:hypothetical protein
VIAVRDHLGPVRAAGMAALLVVCPSASHGQSSTVRQWQYVTGPEGDGCALGLVEVPTPMPGPGEIQVSIRATSLNGRDRYALLGQCGPGGPDGQVALSDGAGSSPSAPA